MKAESSAGNGWQGPCAQVFDHAAVPTLVVSGVAHEVVFANRSARRLLADHSGGVVGAPLNDMGHADDPRGITGVLESCCAETGRFEYLRFRFTPDSGPSVSTEMVVTGCGDIAGVGPAAVVQIRRITLNNGLDTFIDLVANTPDGDDLMHALRWGPLSSLPVGSASLYSVHLEETSIRLRGAFGFSERFRTEHLHTPITERAPSGFVTLQSRTLWASLVEVARRFPLAAPEIMRASYYARGEAVCMPIVSRGSVIGGLYLIFTEPLPQTAARIEQFGTITRVLALWLLLEERKFEKVKPRRGHSQYELSDREHAILRFIEEGRSNGEVAGELGYSEATVRADLSRLYRMLGAGGRREVVQKARELGLYDA